MRDFFYFESAGVAGCCKEPSGPRNPSRNPRRIPQQILEGSISRYPSRIDLRLIALDKLQFLTVGKSPLSPRVYKRVLNQSRTNLEPISNQSWKSWTNPESPEPILKVLNQSWKSWINPESPESILKVLNQSWKSWTNPEPILKVLNQSWTNPKSPESLEPKRRK